MSAGPLAGSGWVLGRLPSYTGGGTGQGGLAGFIDPFSLATWGLQLLLGPRLVNKDWGIWLLQTLTGGSGLWQQAAGREMSAEQWEALKSILGEAYRVGEEAYRRVGRSSAGLLRAMTERVGSPQALRIAGQVAPYLAESVWPEGTKYIPRPTAEERARQEEQRRQEESVPEPLRPLPGGTHPRFWYTTPFPREYLPPEAAVELGFKRLWMPPEEINKEMWRRFGHLVPKDVLAELGVPSGG